MYSVIFPVFQDNEGRSQELRIDVVESIQWLSICQNEMRSETVRAEKHPITLCGATFEKKESYWNLITQQPFLGLLSSRTSCFKSITFQRRILLSSVFQSVNCIKIWRGTMICSQIIWKQVIYSFIFLALNTILYYSICFRSIWAVWRREVGGWESTGVLKKVILLLTLCTYDKFKTLIYWNVK